MRLLGILICAFALAGCGDDDDSGGSNAQPPADEAAMQKEKEAAAMKKEKEEAAMKKDKAAAGSGTEITVGDSEFGPMLFDSNKQAIYIFENDSKGKTVCYDECAEAWPPVLTKGDPNAAGVVESGLLGTTERDDGTTQVTYDGQPLYYYVDDPVGEVLCHNVEEFDGLWLVLGADGAALS